MYHWKKEYLSKIRGLRSVKFMFACYAYNVHALKIINV